MKVNRLLELKNVIGRILSSQNSEDLPQTLTYARGIEYPKFRITIEQIEEDFFIDSKGVKWIKAKSDELTKNLG